MERRAIAIEGTVQGVGFRPFVFGLASRLELGGFVKNQAGGVNIEVEGETGILDQFLSQLVKEPPPLARIEQVSWQMRLPVGDRRFRIEASDGSVGGAVLISPDVGTCEECLAELFDPKDRRFRYPFLNCTHCGPRLTIVTGAPYDRERTTMASFVMCEQCRREYDDPANRRFHAQPTACPVCGPRLSLLDGRGAAIERGDPLDQFVAALKEGAIGAMKGLGGVHLVCDARRSGAVAELRQRKHREEKPFAVMVAGVEVARALCDVGQEEENLLFSARRPIVLLRKRDSIGIVQEVAPRNPYLGVMLPYTPLHHLLCRAMDRPLLMTSGNRSDEPIAYQDEEAVERLSGIADLFLTHNRPIHVRCDDSVTRIIGGAESPVRRSRGYAPQPVRLPMKCPEKMLAVGGQFKGTFALGNENRAILSHHLGDLDHLEAYRAFERDIDLYQRMYAIEPRVIVHDLHPDYASTRYALRRREQGGRTGVRLEGVQHHHAHMASCMAENGLNENVIGVCFDGTGLGTDGTIWGGEFLVGDYRGFRRAAHLRSVGMPGGDRAVGEPWRMGVAHRIDAECLDGAALGECSPGEVRTIRQMLERRFNSPLTSSAGRLFDAVAAIAGVRDRVSYEGQAAIQLEWLATELEEDGAYPVEIVDGQETLVVDTRPLIRAVSQDADRGTDAGRIGRRFHSTMVEIIAQVCRRLRELCGVDAVVLSGGVFMNALLSREVVEKLGKEKFRVYRHRLVPPNDGGLSLGQIAVAAARLGNVD